MFEVRVARPSDIPGIDEMLAKSYPKLLKPDYPASVLVTAIPLISKAQPRLIASGTYYVAERTSDGVIIGAGGWTTRGPQGEFSQGVGHVRHFGTDPDIVRQGVAKAIMAEVLGGAEAVGCRQLACYSTRTAEAFYRAMGFRREKEVEITLRPGIVFPAILMSRTL